MCALQAITFETTLLGFADGHASAASLDLADGICQGVAAAAWAALNAWWLGKMAVEYHKRREFHFAERKAQAEEGEGRRASLPNTTRTFTRSQTSTNKFVAELQERSREKRRSRRVGAESCERSLADYDGPALASSSSRRLVQLRRSASDLHRRWRDATRGQVDAAQHAVGPRSPARGMRGRVFACDES